MVLENQKKSNPIPCSETKSFRLLKPTYFVSSPEATPAVGIGQIVLEEAWYVCACFPIISKNITLWIEKPHLAHPSVNYPLVNFSHNSAFNTFLNEQAFLSEKTSQLKFKTLSILA